MKHHYAHRPSRAMVSLSDLGEYWEVNRVSVPSACPSNRGRGIARYLMGQVLYDADTEGVALRLVIFPDGSPGSLSHSALASWYGRLGFVRRSYLGSGGSFWERQPGATQSVCGSRTGTVDHRPCVEPAGHWQVTPHRSSYREKERAAWQAATTIQLTTRDDSGLRRT